MSFTCFKEIRIKLCSIGVIVLLITNLFYCCLAAKANEICNHQFGQSQQATKSAYPDTLGTGMLQQEIDRLQTEILKAVKAKSSITAPDDKKGSGLIDASIITTIDAVQQTIDTDLRLDNNEKQTILKRWQILLDATLSGINNRSLAASKIPLLLRVYEETITMVPTGNTILPLIKRSDLSVARIILIALTKEKTINLQDSKAYLASETLTRDPANFFPVLFDLPDVSNADSLLPIAARQLPEDLYTYSQATNSQLGRKILNSKDSLVQLIVEIAKLPQGRLYFPFLDDLYHKKLSLALVKNTLGEDQRVLYYKLLVRTLTGYNKRLAVKDTAIAFQYLVNRITLSASDDFVRVINSLHEYNDDVRLKVIKNLTASELYYLCISGVNDLYTSSYLKIYRRIFSNNISLNSYAFLKTVYFDHFKRFLKMASTFNTLDDFLGRMKKEEADTLMHSFIDDLTDKSAVEDAVDVADSYASIRNKNLQQFILKEIQNKINSSAKDTPGPPRIYSLLNTLFLSLDAANHINLTKSLGIANVYRIDNSDLKDLSGKITVQQFFYGDTDGKYAFDVFLKSFRNSGWKIIKKQYWIELLNITGTPVHIYANLPLDDNTNQAEYAQQLLSDYLKAKSITPSIIIHRGHSYHLDNTLKHLSAGNKLIFIGSCGGYNQLSQVYKASPLAQIVATKQEGSIIINQPLINYVTGLLANGKNLDWQAIWGKLAVRFKGDNRFQDYVPPYQNLGAILLMALDNPDFKAK